MTSLLRAYNRLGLLVALSCLCTLIVAGSTATATTPSAPATYRYDGPVLSAQVASASALHVRVAASGQASTNAGSTSSPPGLADVPAEDAALVIRGGSQGAFDIAPRVFGQLRDPRLGRLAGRLSPGDLEGLANAPSASRYMDARTGNINVIQKVQGVTLRITTPRDAMRIISVGPIRARQVANRVAAGDFIPLP